MAAARAPAQCIRRNVSSERHHRPVGCGRHDERREFLRERRILESHFRRANPWRTAVDNHTFGQQRHHFMAEHRQLHLAAKREPRAGQWLGDQRLYHQHRQRHEQHHHHLSNGQSVLSALQSLNSESNLYLSTETWCGRSDAYLRTTSSFFQEHWTELHSRSGCCRFPMSRQQ